jgi:predicted CopG family antitoxin
MESPKKATTISLPAELKEELGRLKAAPREPYSEVIKRLLEAYKEREAPLVKEVQDG